MIVMTRNVNVSQCCPCQSGLVIIISISPVTKYQKEENKSRSKYHNVRVIMLSRPLHLGTAT